MMYRYGRTYREGFCCRPLKMFVEQNRTLTVIFRGKTIGQVVFCREAKTKSMPTGRHKLMDSKFLPSAFPKVDVFRDPGAILFKMFHKTLYSPVCFRKIVVVKIDV